MTLRKLALIAGLVLGLAAPASAEPEYLCPDALVRVTIVGTPRGPRLRFDFRPGYERCEDHIRRVVPLAVEGKPCIGVEFLGGAQLVFCAGADLKF